MQEEDDEEEKESLDHYIQARDECLANLRQDFGNLLRSKGFFWLANERRFACTWSHAGVVLQIAKESTWYATVPEVRPHQTPGSLNQLPPECFKTNKWLSGLSTLSASVAGYSVQLRRSVFYAVRPWH